MAYGLPWLIRKKTQKSFGGPNFNQGQEFKKSGTQNSGTVEDCEFLFPRCSPQFFCFENGLGKPPDCFGGWCVPGGLEKQPWENAWCSPIQNKLYTATTSRAPLGWKRSYTNPINCPVVFSYATLEKLSKYTSYLWMFQCVKIKRNEQIWSTTPWNFRARCPKLPYVKPEIHLLRKNNIILGYQCVEISGGVA